jgi:2-keto-3-deoxy-L-rhamnonate aldolase RhmA
MELPVNAFKRALASGATPIGSWLSSGSTAAAEALGCAGFDFLVVDTEHAPVDPPQMVELLRAIAGTPASAIVRPAWNDLVMVKRAMDAGAQTLLFPYVQDADEARRAVASTRYPPQGTRGVAGTHRASRFGAIADYVRRAGAEICVVVQIETLPALARLEAIAAVPGVDSIFVGPADLSASMGHLGDAGHPDVMETLGDAARRCHAAGKPCGIIGGTPELVARYLEQGYSWVAVASDMAMMVSRANEYLAKVRASVPMKEAPHA